MSEAWLEQFEVRLELMEQRISSEETAFHEVLELARQAFAVLGTDASLDAFLVRPDSIERFADDGTTEAVSSEPGADSETLRRSLSNYARTSGAPTFVGVHELAVGVKLACRFVVNRVVAPEHSCVEGATAIAAVIASLISRRLLSQYESKYSQQTNLVSVIAQLAGASSFPEAASILVQDGASVLGDCRITVLSESAGRLQIQAVTGVSAPNSSSETVTELEDFASKCCLRQQTSVWLTMDEVTSISEPMASVFASSNVTHVQIVSLADSQQSTSASPCIVIESFGLPLPEQFSVHQLVQTAGPIVRRHQRLSQSVWSRLFVNRTVRRVLLALVAVIILVVVPADFEIAVDGQIQATVWRRIYAPSNGTVESVDFDNEQRVAEDDRLLRMSNPDLELSLQRVLGEIQKTRVRLAAAETGRLTGANPQASSDEQILQVELANLIKDKSLIELQNRELTVTAPFGGTVFLNDPQKELDIRPVQRGQLLCQIVASDSGWQLELDVPEELRQYLRSASAGGIGQDVRYLIKASPDRDWLTTLSQVDSAVQVRKGQLVCRATAGINELPEADRRPGTSVSARIYCGRRSLGFVWFREVIEVWRKSKFAWL